MMFYTANFVARTLRKSTMKKIKFTPDQNCNGSFDIHKSTYESFPFILNQRHTKDTRKTDFRDFGLKAGDDPPDIDSTATTESRMYTFIINSWHSPRWYPRYLADAGFYYRGNGTEVHCYQCNLKTDVSAWADRETPALAHARLAKTCQFVVDNHYDLIPKIAEPPRESYQTVRSEKVRKPPEADGTIESSSNKTSKTIQKGTSGNLDGNENKNNSRSFVQEMQTNQSAYKPFDIMSDGFTGLTIDKKIEDVQPSCDQQNRDSNENITTERNNVFPTMEAMNSQITQDGLQSYHQEFKYPQFQSVDARYRSFDTWRFTHKQTPRKLSEAGYFYTGENDIVRCFCCDLGLAEWDPKDNPWIEHARHNPKCWFLLSEKGEQFIESIQQDWKKIYNPKHAAFDDKESRIATFDGWRTDIEQTPEILADAGFFYTGEEDTVRCHYCDGGLRNWEPKDVPWEEHARWFPFCKFVIKMKGREFIEYIKRKSEEKQRLENSTSTSSSSGLPDDIRDSPVVKQLTTFGIDEDNIRYAITEFTKRTGNSNFTVETLTELIFNRNDQHQINSPFAAKNFIETEKPEEQDPKKIKELNRKLKDKMKCIRCRTNDICMLFVNCGHRQTCEECADLMDFCPICDTRIKKRLKTFLS